MARYKSSGVFLIAARQADTIRCEPEDRREGHSALRDGRGAACGDDCQRLVACGAGGEEAMEPKFLRDMREEDEGQGEA
jgi:hypothetical protein